MVTIEELAEAVRSVRVDISGTGSNATLRRPRAAAKPLKMDLAGIVEHDIDDQVVVVRAGTSIQDLQDALKGSGQCIPLGPEANTGTVGGRVAMNLPHSLEFECGTWRDWVIGMTIMDSDGNLAKCGSKAVKNVAGYDVQKLFIGSRGTLGLIVNVILRTFPIKALPEANIQKGKEQSERGIIQRVLPTDFEAAVDLSGSALIEAHPHTATIIHEAFNLPRFPRDWMLKWGYGNDNYVIDDVTQGALMLRTKGIFDPKRRFNPGEMGIF